jgi:hypothetical protein
MEPRLHLFNVEIEQFERQAKPLVSFGVPLAWLVEFFAREVEKGGAQQREHRYAK